MLLLLFSLPLFAKGSAGHNFPIFEEYRLTSIQGMPPSPQKEAVLGVLAHMQEKGMRRPKEIWIFPSEEKLGFGLDHAVYFSEGLFQLLAEPVFATYVVNHLLAHSQRGDLERRISLENFDFSSWLKRGYDEEDEVAADRYSYFALAYLGFSLDDLLPFLSSAKYLFAPHFLSFKKRFNAMRRIRSEEMNEEDQLGRQKSVILLAHQPLSLRAIRASKQGALFAAVGAIAGAVVKEGSPLRSGLAGFAAGFLGSLFAGFDLVRF